MTEVLLRREGSVAWLTLNRPEALNALSPGLVAALDRRVQEVEDEPEIKVVVLTGAGRAFCAGADLRALTDADGDVDTDVAGRLVRQIGLVIERLGRLPKPVIGAVNGIAVAGGLELLLVCDVIIAGRGAKIGDGHVTYSLLPGAGASARLTQQLGPRWAKRLMLSGELFPAKALVDCGLVERVVPDDLLVKEVDAFAQHLAAKDSRTMAELKRLVDASLDLTTAEALAAEVVACDTHLRSDEVRAGLAAFREKRRA